MDDGQSLRAAGLSLRAISATLAGEGKIGRAGTRLSAETLSAMLRTGPKVVATHAIEYDHRRRCSRFFPRWNDLFIPYFPALSLTLKVEGSIFALQPPQTEGRPRTSSRERRAAPWRSPGGIDHDLNAGLCEGARTWNTQSCTALSTSRPPPISSTAAPSSSKSNPFPQNAGTVCTSFSGAWRLALGRLRARASLLNSPGISGFSRKPRSP